jgi:hypothetical protein
MNSNQPTEPDDKDKPASGGIGTESDAKGGNAAARDAAERDWQDSAKDAGE